MNSWDPHSVRVVEGHEPVFIQQSHKEEDTFLTRRSRFPQVNDNNKLFCLVLTLLILCASGVLIAVLVAGVIWASQSA